MVLEPKREPSTDGTENRIGIKGVSYTCNENHNKEYVHIEIDMPPANGHLVSSVLYITILFYYTYRENVHCTYIQFKIFEYGICYRIYSYYY